MQRNSRSWLPVIAAIASMAANSCHTPTANAGMGFMNWEINVVSSNGLDHRVLLGGGPIYGSSTVYFLPTMNGIVLYGGKLQMVDYDGSHLIQLSSDFECEWCSSSSDESRVLLTSLVIDSNQVLNNLYLMNSDGRNLVQLAPRQGEYGYPHISPNLDEIVFCRDNSVATLNVDGSNLQYITRKSTSSICTYSLYVDENHILYFEDWSSMSSIRVFDKRNQQDKLIGIIPTGTPGVGRIFAGGKLLFVDRDTISVLDIYTANVRKLTWGFSPSYSFDGSKIVYCNWTSICTMNGDGSIQQIIYTEPEATGKHIMNPQFSADGRFVVFATYPNVIVD